MDKLFWDKHFGCGIYVENLNYEAEDLICLQEKEIKHEF
jgi:hypothetical protein